MIASENRPRQGHRSAGLGPVVLLVMTSPLFRPAAPLAGCAFVALLAIGLLVALALAHPVLLSLTGCAVIALVVTLRVRHTARLRAAVARFRELYPGRRMLIVYTDSPHWGAYIESNWMSRWGQHAVVLNRTRPWRRDSAEAVLWREAGGFREHTPLVVIVPGKGSVRTVRFFKAFRDNRHGKPQRLQDAEAVVSEVLSRAASGEL